jgi:hypothetical protein
LPFFMCLVLRTPENLDASSASPHPHMRSLAVTGGQLMDHLATLSEFRQQAVRCHALARTANDERVRALLVSMAQMWTKLADAAERIQRLKAEEATRLATPSAVFCAGR